MKNQSLTSNRFINHYSYLFRIVIIFFLCSCTTIPNSPTEIGFFFGPDDTGTLQKLIDQFNKEHKGLIKVTLKQGSRSSDLFYDQLAEEFNAGQASFDVFAADVVWTAAFAQNEWVIDLTEKFFDEYQPESFVKPAMESASYQYRIWGIPWFTDAGILFYRKDLLDKIGVLEAPSTWSELSTLSQRLMDQKLIDIGYVFQGAAYEGGVTNVCEYIWNAGGNILLGDLSLGEEFDVGVADPGVITVKSPESLIGLKDVKKLVDNEIAPKNIFQYRELDANDDFKSGKAAFMRSWPGSYGILLSRKSDVKPEQVGFSHIPTSSINNKSYSCLGGWNLMINVHSDPDKQEAAWAFIQFLVNEEAQRYRAIDGGFLPSLRGLYADQDLLDASPVVAFTKQVIANTRERPKTPYYQEISREIATIYNQILIGVLEPEQALERLDTKLKEVFISKQAIN